MIDIRHGYAAEQGPSFGDVTNIDPNVGDIIPAGIERASDGAKQTSRCHQELSRVTRSPQKWRLVLLLRLSKMMARLVDRRRTLSFLRRT